MENIYPKGEDERIKRHEEIRNKEGGHSEAGSGRLKGKLYGSGVGRRRGETYKQR
jgi:hypothetical protein